MSHLTLIGVTGAARSGKDTFAQVLVRRGFTRVAFGDTIKEIAALVSGDPLHYFHDDVLKEGYSEDLGMTRRAAMQRIGTEMFRSQFGEDVWVRCAMRKIVGEMHVVITDVRYDNEARAIRRAGGCVVLITRPGNVGLGGEASKHSSEQGVSPDLIDIEVLNDGSIGDLHAEARKIAAISESAL